MWESPFLDEELFVGESEEEWEPRTTRHGPGLRSPFLDELAFESPPQSGPGFEATEAFAPVGAFEGVGAFESPSVIVEQALPPPPRSPAGAPQVPATEVATRPRLRFVAPSGKPYSASRWVVVQGGNRFEGALDANGWTGAIDAARDATGGARFDKQQPFTVHVEGGVCCIVSGAALQVGDPTVEYAGSWVDWRLADEPADFPHRSQFWKEYDEARRQAPGPQRVFTFTLLQHDHVMRRPVKLLARHTSAVFQVQPVAIRLGPIVRYTDSRRTLVWLELETPGLVRIRFGRATQQQKIPARSDTPAQTGVRHGCTVRVGGRHYALVWLDGLEPDTGLQYTVETAPQPPSGALPVNEADYTEAVFPRELPVAVRVATQGTLARHAYSGSPWLFFRTLAERSESLRFAHGSCRKYPNDTDPEQKAPPDPDMLDAFGDRWLARKEWREWPRFFLHSGDQIYADDVGVRMAREMLAQRASAAVSGPAPAGALDVAYGAWSGRFGWRYAPFEKPGSAAPRADFDALKRLRPRAGSPAKDDQLEAVIAVAARARKQAGWFRNHDPRPAGAGRQRYRFRVLNGLLWQPPDVEADVPHIDKTRGLSVRQVIEQSGPNVSPKRSFDLEYPAAGDNLGVHAADYAEYAALYEQAFGLRHTRRLLAHLPSFMIFDDHEVTDDWNADKGWLKIIHSTADPLRCWPMTITDALCAYWLYQGWGNLAPEQAARDPRVQVIDRARREGRDALPALRRLVLKHAVEVTAAGASRADKLDWHFSLPTPGLPFHVVDLRTDRDVNDSGGLSPARLRWLEQSLSTTRSPVAVLVLPVPFLMPDPMLFAFRNPSFTAALAGARSTTAFRRGSDLEHPADQLVWDQIKGLLKRLQASSTALKSVALLSGDIHFSCNFDGQIADVNREPRLVQLISSGLRQVVSDAKQKKLDLAYRGWLNAVSRAQGVEEHRGICITLGGMQGPGGKLRNFLFAPSAAVVDITLHAFGAASAPRTRVPLIVQTHLASDGSSGLQSWIFRHMTQPGGSAVMSLKDPGFAHPTSPKDYPAATSGIGIAREALEPIEEADEAAHLFEADAFEVPESQGFDPGMAPAADSEAFDVEALMPETIDEESIGPTAGGIEASEIEANDTEANDAEASAHPESFGAEPEAEIIGTVDDRVHVADTRRVPFRWICAIDVKTDSASGARGSGVLIGPRHVLTAAHVVRAGAAWELRLSPARNGDNSKHPFGRYAVKGVHYPLPYRVGKRLRTDDYALLRLDRDVPAQLAFWGADPAQAQLRALATNALNGQQVQVAGYPGDRCGTDAITGDNDEVKMQRIGACRSRRPDDWASTQWRASGTARANDAWSFVFYDADTYGGQSGGPVSLVIRGVHVCVAIHVNGTLQANWGVRVTLRMLNDLRDWINADAGSEIASVAGDALAVEWAGQRAAQREAEDREAGFERRAALVSDPSS